MPTTTVTTRISKKLSLIKTQLKTDPKCVQVYSDSLEYWTNITDVDTPDVMDVDITRYDYRIMIDGDIVVELLPIVFIS